MAWTPKTKGTMVWLGNYGSKKFGKHHTNAGALGKTSVAGTASAAELVAFMTALETYTDCTKSSWSWTFTYQFTSDPPVSGTVSPAKKAIIYAKRANGDIVRMTIPGIKDAYIEYDRDGKKLITADMNAIVALWSTAVGETLSGLFSKVEDVS